jgi:hypothetical protein
MLPTPQAMDYRQDIRKPEERSDAANKGGCSNLREKVMQLLPTPNASDFRNPNNKEDHDVQKGYLRGVCSQQPIADTEGEGAWQFTSKNCRRKDGRFNDISQDGFVAHSIDNNRRCAQSNRHEKGEFILGESKRFSEKRTIADTNIDGLQGSIQPGGDGEQGWDRQILSAPEHLHTHGGSAIQRGRWHDFPTQSPICSRNDGIPGGLDGITFSKWRNESIKGYGNAVVVPLVEVIFKAINQYREKYEHQ